MEVLVSRAEKRTNQVNTEVTHAPTTRGSGAGNVAGRGSRHRCGSSRRTRTAVFECVIAMMALALPVDAATFYVERFASPGDSGPGTAAQPWATINHAAGNVSPGDKVIVRPGTYPERVIIETNGTGSAPIVFESEIPHAATTRGFAIEADHILVKGFTVTDTNEVGVLTAGSHIAIVNNRVIEVGDAAFGAWNTSDNLDQAFTGVKILGNYAYKCRYGIIATGLNWLIEGNEIERLIKGNSNGDSDYSRFFGRGHVFRRNFFHGTQTLDTCPEGFTQYSNSDCAHVDAFQTFNNNGEEAINITFEQNWAQDFHQGVFIADNRPGDNSVRNFTIVNNVLAKGGGLAELNKSARLREIPDSVVANNLVFDTVSGWDIRNDATGVITRNIHYGLARSYISEDTEMDLLNNVTWPNNFDKRNDVVANPKLANPNNLLGPDGRPFTADDGWFPSQQFANYGPQILGLMPFADDDADLLPNGAETMTGTFVDASDTGTDPGNPDTDGDGIRDGIEVSLGTDPNNANDFPTGLPLGPATTVAIVLALGGCGAAGIRKRFG